jgi:L-ascorbate metabolism protein UlaG (beta-lactamase superfamily)
MKTIPKVEIVKSHEALLAEIEATQTPYGQAAFWWMGQHTFIVKAGSKVIYFDPWFADWDSRQTAALLTPQECRLANVALISHGHADHLCPDTLPAMAQASPLAVFVCPRTEAERLTGECGIAPERIHPINAGEIFEADGIRVTAIKSKHEHFDEHPVHGFPYLGYVVETNGVTLYHAGDTIPYEGHLTTLAQWKHFDVMFLPINGRDAERYLRNCAGNLTFQESAELAGELRPGLAVAAHWDMFVGNQEDPALFVDFLSAKYPGVQPWVGRAGELVVFPA